MLMGKKKPLISIITPIYNRQELLEKCYESLVAQTSKAFEWIVIDDGSTDNTKDIMGEICNKELSFSIKYIWKENGGKHTALNAAHPYIEGKYVLILDSDDTLTEDAVMQVLVGWEKYEKDSEVGIVIFLKKTQEGEVCSYAKDEYKKVHLLTYQRTRNVSTDCCEVLRAELFKKYPFPAFKGEKFLAETALWNRIALDSLCVYINIPIYICTYHEDGLTKSGRKMRVSNPIGGMYTSYLRMNKQCRMKERIKAALLFVCYGKYAGEPFVKIIRKAKEQKILCLAAWIPGNLMYLQWKKKY